MTSAIYSVPAISCEHCVTAITQEVRLVDGVETVDVNLETKIVTVVGGAEDAVIAAIDEAGYDIEAPNS